MEIPKGYKQTELGIIPEDWEVTNLGKGLSFQVGFPFLSSSFNIDGIGLRLIRNRDLKSNDQIIYYFGNYKINYIVNNGDILIGMDGDFLPCLWQKGPALLNQRVGRILVKDKWDKHFLYYLLFEPLQLKQATTGATTVKHLSHNDIENLELPIPPYKEQSIIAQALSDVDGLIAALDRKIAKKRLIKQGAMQQLLIGKKRLPGFTEKWHEIRLGDNTTLNSGGTPLSSNPEYYNGNIPFLSISDISIAGKYISSTEKSITEKGLNNSSARIFSIGTIMYAMYASFGKCAIANIDLACSQAILGITPSKSLNSEYLYYYFTFIEEWIKCLGQTGTQTNLSKQLVQELTISLPQDIIEQQAIATILSDMDKEIANLEARRDKYKLVKNGMMQKLLTGQIRLVTPCTR